MGILRTNEISGLETPTAVTGSVSFDGNDHLSIGAPGDFNFLHNALSDWTVEFWTKTGTATRQFVWGTGASSAQTGFSLTIMSQADGQADASGVYAIVGRGSAGNYRYWGANNCLLLDTWHHIAAVFKSSDKTLAIYVDGREVDNDTGTENGTFSTTDYSTSDSSYAFIVGKNIHSDGVYMNGEISNLRVVAGRRLYTSDFTPPVHALEPINGTRILCCNNSDSVTAVSNAGIGTAHIATASGDPTVGTDYPGLTRDFTSGTQFQGVAKFDTQGYFVPPSGTTEQRGRGRGIFAGGFPGPTNTIQYVTIATLGNSSDFGDLIEASRNIASAASSTTGIFGGGQTPGNSNVIQYITIQSTGNAFDFGDLTIAKRNFMIGCCSSNTRGLFAGGSPVPAETDKIEYITIASKGNSSDFGVLTVARRNGGTTTSPTRAVFASGTTPSFTNIIDFVTIATTGNAQDFGDSLTSAEGKPGCGSATRGIFGGGQAPGFAETIDYITIASLGNAQDFGDLTQSRGGIAACSSSLRGVFAGGTRSAPATNSNVIDYVTIATLGDAVNFGDLISEVTVPTGLSDTHGGLGD